MNKRLRRMAASLILIPVLCAACGNVNPNNSSDDPSKLTTQTPQEVPPMKVDSEKLTKSGVLEANQQFAFGLFSRLALAEKDKNHFISPTSVAMALGMAWNGTATTSRTEMATAMGYGLLDRKLVNESYDILRRTLLTADPGVEIQIANAMWGTQDIEFKADFVGRNQDFYRAIAKTLDFTKPEAVKTINDWVNVQTKEKIPTLFDQLDPATIMVLTNAVYFKGKWTDPFEKALTTDLPFYLLDGSNKQHPMMTRSDRFRYVRDEVNQFQAVSLPYGNGAYRLVVILPDQASSLEKLVSYLSPATWKNFTQAMRSKQGTVVLPKFKLKDDKALSDTLIAMGMPSLFDGQKADFSDMLDTAAGSGFAITQVKHKTFVDVNEEGTEAAAATGVVVGATSVMPIPDPPFDMTVDRPFFCAIEHVDTGSLLFMGAIANPQYE